MHQDIHPNKLALLRLGILQGMFRNPVQQSQSVIRQDIPHKEVLLLQLVPMLDIAINNNPRLQSVLVLDLIFSSLVQLQSVLRQAK
jgi:hypothetical protein